jgi:hypothetical protein
LGGLDKEKMIRRRTRDGSCRRFKCFGVFYSPKPEEKVKYCPLLSDGYAIVHRAKCLKEECAWWNEEKNDCIIVTSLKYPYRKKS